MTAHVSEASNTGNGVASIAVTITGTAGNLLIAGISCFDTTAARAISTVTDSSGGTNVWNYSTLANNQNPPVESFQDGSSLYYTMSAIAWSQTTAAVTTVTVTFNTAPNIFANVTVDQFSGIPAGYLPGGAAYSVATAITTTYTSIPIGALPGAAVVVATGGDSNTNNWSSVAAPFTLASSFGAWAIPTGRGPLAATFTTSGASGNADGSVAFAMGAIPIKSSEVNVWQAVKRASLW